MFARLAKKPTQLRWKPKLPRSTTRGFFFSRAGSGLPASWGYLILSRTNSRNSIAARTAGEVALIRVALPPNADCTRSIRPTTAYRPS
jgi:hypothetical protein